MALAVNQIRDYHSALGIVPDRRMPTTGGAGAIIFQGSFLGRSSGYVRALVAADSFAGISDDYCDNVAGAAGDKSVIARREGMILMDVVGVTGIGDEDALVYASDDNTLTLTSTANSLIGRIERWVSGTKCWVRFWAAGTKP